MAHHTSQAIQNGRESNLTWGIKVMWNLRSSSSKVEYSIPLYAIERNADYTHITSENTEKTDTLFIDGDFQNYWTAII